MGTLELDHLRIRWSASLSFDFLKSDFAFSPDARTGTGARWFVYSLRSGSPEDDQDRREGKVRAMNGLDRMSKAPSGDRDGNGGHLSEIRGARSPNDYPRHDSVPVFEIEQNKFGAAFSGGGDGGSGAWLLRRDRAELWNVLLAGPDVGAQLSRRNLSACRAVD